VLITKHNPVPKITLQIMTMIHRSVGLDRFWNICYCRCPKLCARSNKHVYGAQWPKNWTAFQTFEFVSWCTKVFCPKLCLNTLGTSSVKQYYTILRIIF